MDIELLYFDDCPNWHIAHERLTEALAATGRPDQRITLTPVHTDAEAKALRFPGSPTIRVNGHDPFPAAAGEYSLSCRVYTTPDGLAGTPSVKQLTQILAS